MEKWIALLLCVFLAGALLGGCSQKVQPVSTAGTPAPTQETAAGPEPSPTATSQPAPSELPEEKPDQEEGALIPTLEFATLPEGMEQVDTYENEGGEYGSAYLAENGLVYFAMYTLRSAEYGEESITASIERMSEVDALEDYQIVQDEGLSEKLSYPVWRATYLTGENEDTSNHIDIYIQTDGWDLYFTSSIDADNNEEGAQVVEEMIAGMEIISLLPEGVTG